jgi:uncharacterized membrane protein SpoIIM required for sporulation
VDERSFIERKRESWEALSGVLEKAGQQDLKRLTADEIKSLGSRYRALVSDLSYARSQGASDGLVTYLNELAGRAHGVLYSAKPAPLRAVPDFLARGFPRLFRSTFAYTLAAALIFFGAWAIPATNQQICDAVFPQKITAPEKGDENGSFFEHIDPAFMSSAIMANNIQVGILAFAGGVTAGTVTVYQMASNGLKIGAIATKASVVLGPKRFWALILPHGIIELTAIFVCGGAGFMIGYAFIAPGNLRRYDAIRRAGSKAVRLFAGAAVMFIIAGTIEGFVTPSALPETSKLAFAGVTALALAYYFCFAGTSKPNTE